MARTARANSSPSPNPRLPGSLRGFRQLLAMARTEAQRDALLVQIAADFPAYRAAFSGREGPAAVRSKAGAAFEARLIAFVEHPKITREFGWDLQPSHATAWMDLVGIRSKRFARMLRRWARGDDSGLAAMATRHLAWMAFDVDVPCVLRALRAGPWRLRAAVGHGLQGAAEGRFASPAFRDLMFDALAPFVCGEHELPLTDAADKALDAIAGALVALRPGRALHLLRQDQALHTANRAVWHVLWTLVRIRDENPGRFTRCPRPSLLWPIFGALKDRTLRLPNDTPRREHAMGLILSLAADGDPHQTVRACRDILKARSGEMLRRAARDALRRCRDEPDADTALQVFWRCPTAFRGKAALVMHAYALVDHIASDGLHGYLDNLGEHRADAVRGLRLLGQHAAAQIVEAAAAAADEAASQGREARSTNSRTPPVEQRLARLEQRILKHDAKVRAAVDRYIADHPGAFKAASPTVLRTRGKGPDSARGRPTSES